MDVAQLIKTIRTQLGLSQQAFAEEINVAFATVNRWENNKSTPHRMARALLVDYCEKHGVDNELIAAIKDKRW